jgi:hypothetical protein
MAILHILWTLGAVIAFYLLIRTRLWISAGIHARRLQVDAAKP